MVAPRRPQTHRALPDRRPTRPGGRAGRSCVPVSHDRSQRDPAFQLARRASSVGLSLFPRPGPCRWIRARRKNRGTCFVPPGADGEGTMATAATHRLGNGAPTHGRETLRVRIASGLGTAVVLAVLVTGLAFSPDARAEIDFSLLGWMLLAFVASLATISIVEHEPVLSMDLPVLLACAFIKGPWAAGLVAYIG